MGYFPFFAEVENSRWLIVGGGTVAFRKARELLPFGVCIQVVSPEIIPSFRQMKESGWEEKITFEEREFKERDLLNTQFVIAATSSQELNCQIGILCKSRGIPVNVADAKENCTFLFPSLIKDHDVTIGITTGGVSPALARLLKARLLAAMPAGLGELAGQLGSAREMVKEAFPHSPRIRSAILTQLARTGLDSCCRLTTERIRETINRKLEEEHE